MTKLTFKNIADKYDLFEEDVEKVFACYDTNDMDGMIFHIRYCFFCMGAWEYEDFLFDINQYTEFLFDVIQYIKQCSLEREQDFTKKEDKPDD